MKICRLLIGLLAGGALATASELKPLDLTRPVATPQGSFTVSPTGLLTVRSGANTFQVTTRMSFPQMPSGGWLTVPDAKVRTTARGKGFEIRQDHDSYTLIRTVEPDGNRLKIADTFENRSGKELAIAFDTSVSLVKGGTIPIYLAGTVNNKAEATTPDVPSPNTTIFMAAPGGGLGVVLEDDYYRLQVTLRNSAHQADIINRSFGLPAGGRYTFEWTIYYAADDNYWHFINQVRRDWGVNGEVRGNVLFGSIPHKDLCRGSFPEAIFKEYYRNLGARYFASHNYSWLESSNNSIVGSRRRDASYVSVEQHLREAGTAVKNARKLGDDARAFIKMGLPFVGPAQLPGQPVPMADSVFIEPDGKPLERKVKDKDGKLLGSCQLRYPTLENSYYKYLDSLIERNYRENGGDLIYFDTFSYAYWTKYGRWTYDRWDNRTVDIDEKTWTIARKKADVAMLASDAQVALLEKCVAKGGTALLNHTLHTRKQNTMLHKVITFTETHGAGLAKTRHLSQPTVLGYSPGYQWRGKDGWQSVRDMHEDVLAALEYGCVPYVYLPVRRVDQPLISRRIFPFTVKNIYAGCIEAEEKIITMVDGRYTFGSRERPAVYIYDADGKESVADGKQAQIVREKGRYVVTLKLPEGGAAVIFKEMPVDEALEKELDFN